MSDLEPVARPQLVLAGEPCRACGAPLAEDQRYCLACGERRGPQRLPFGDLARPAPAAAEDAPTVATSRFSPFATALAGIACLVLALGVGVLIGTAGDDAPPAAAPAQVISVGGTAPSASTTPATSTDAAPAADEGAATTTPTDAEGDDSATDDGSGTSGAADPVSGTDSGHDSGASTPDPSKESEKLPKELGTGGEPPPKDTTTAPAGGGDFEEIG